MVTGIAPDMGEGIVNAVITYEDEAGNESRIEKNVNLYVYEIVEEDFSMMEDMSMETEEPVNQGIPAAIIIAIVIVLIIVIIVVVILIKKRKAKKQKEDMDLLDEDDV